MRATAVIASTLALGAAALLRRRRQARDDNARRWAAATDALGVRSFGRRA